MQRGEINRNFCIFIIFRKFSKLYIIDLRLEKYKEGVEGNIIYTENITNTLHAKLKHTLFNVLKKILSFIRLVCFALVRK